MWQQGQQVEVEITDLTDEGSGVGRYQERVIFVPDTVPGDMVRVRLNDGQVLQGKVIRPGVVEITLER